MILQIAHGDLAFTECLNRGLVHLQDRLQGLRIGFLTRPGTGDDRRNLPLLVREIGCRRQQFSRPEHIEGDGVDTTPGDGRRPYLHQSPIKGQLVVFALLDLGLAQLPSFASRPLEVDDDIISRFVLEQQVDGAGDRQRVITGLRDIDLLALHLAADDVQVAEPEDIRQFRDADLPEVGLELLPVHSVFRKVQFGAGGQDGFVEEGVEFGVEHPLKRIGIDLRPAAGGLDTNPVDDVMGDQALDQRVVAVAFLIQAQNGLEHPVHGLVEHVFQRSRGLVVGEGQAIDCRRVDGQRLVRRKRHDRQGRTRFGFLARKRLVRKLFEGVHASGLPEDERMLLAFLAGEGVIVENRQGPAHVGKTRLEKVFRELQGVILQPNSGQDVFESVDVFRAEKGQRLRRFREGAVHPDDIPDILGDFLQGRDDGGRVDDSVPGKGGGRRRDVLEHPDEFLLRNVQKPREPEILALELHLLAKGDKLLPLIQVNAALSFLLDQLGRTCRPLGNLVAHRLDPLVGQGLARFREEGLDFGGQGGIAPDEVVDDAVELGEPSFPDDTAQKGAPEGLVSLFIGIQRMTGCREIVAVGLDVATIQQQHHRAGEEVGDGAGRLRRGGIPVRAAEGGHRRRERLVVGTDEEGVPVLGRRPEAGVETVVEMLDFHLGLSHHDNILDRNSAPAKLVEHGAMDRVQMVFRDMDLHGETVQGRLLFQGVQENPPTVRRRPKAGGKFGFHLGKPAQDGFCPGRKPRRDADSGLPSGEDELVAPFQQLLGRRKQREPNGLGKENGRILVRGLLRRLRIGGQNLVLRLFLRRNPEPDFQPIQQPHRADITVFDFADTFPRFPGPGARIVLWIEMECYHTWWLFA